jgi:hypothetical protein
MSNTPISLFVDDERQPTSPKWTIARNCREAMNYFREEKPFDIKELSLDWYMGSRELDGVFIAREMVGCVEYLDLQVFKNTSAIWLHSSDREQAIKQARIFEEAQTAGFINPNCRIRLNINCKRAV